MHSRNIITAPEKTQTSLSRLRLQEKVLYAPHSPRSFLKKRFAVPHA